MLLQGFCIFRSWKEYRKEEILAFGYTILNTEWIYTHHIIKDNSIATEFNFTWFSTFARSGKENIKDSQTWELLRSFLIF